MAENSHDMLRSLPDLPTAMPAFDTATAPQDPVSLFVRWLNDAIENQVPGPHAMTLSTTDSEGRPSSFELICTDVSQGGQWYFASLAGSLRSRKPNGNPHAALTFHWPRFGRQISIRGTVTPAGSKAGDFTAGPPGSHDEALISRQSTPLEDPAELQAAFEQTLAHLTADRGLIAPTWTLYALTAQEVEFCQADHERRHTRLRYDRTDTLWRLQRLRQ